MLALVLVAGSLALSNFAASIAIGLSGVDHAVRARVVLAFGIFEAGMPIIGLLLGRTLAGALGEEAHIIGGLLLIAVGGHTVYTAARSSEESTPSYARARFGELLVLAAVLSIDNLIVGFALGTYRAPIALSILIIAALSVGLSVIGLELGARVGTWVGRRSELVGGIVLGLVGLAILTHLL
jgi:manganese efflux pump family protein